MGYLHKRRELDGWDPDDYIQVHKLLPEFLSFLHHVIKYFFNCMTDSANRHGKLTLDDIHKCLYKEYGVYSKLPYGTFSHSFRGGRENIGH